MILHKKNDADDVIAAPVCGCETIHTVSVTTRQQLRTIRSKTLEHFCYRLTDHDTS